MHTLFKALEYMIRPGRLPGLMARKTEAHSGASIRRHVEPNVTTPSRGSAQNRIGFVLQVYPASYKQFRPYLIRLLQFSAQAPYVQLPAAPQVSTKKASVKALMSHIQYSQQQSYIKDGHEESSCGPSEVDVFWTYPRC